MERNKIKDLVNLKELKTEGERFCDLAEDSIYLVIDEFATKKCGRLTDEEIDYLLDELRPQLKEKIIETFNNF